MIKYPQKSLENCGRVRYQMLKYSHLSEFTSFFLYVCVPKQHNIVRRVLDQCTYTCTRMRQPKKKTHFASGDLRNKRWK